MPGARLTTEPPLPEISGGLRTLKRDLAVDLGRRVPELERWFAEARPAGLVVSSGGGSTSIRVRAGLVYDGASLPAGLLVRLLAGPKEKYEAASVFHDALYQAGAPRAAADLVFWVVARSGVENVGAFRAWATWAALRVGGWRAYRRHRRRGR